MAGTAESNQHRPQSDKGSMSLANTTAPSLHYSIIKDLYTVSYKCVAQRRGRNVFTITIHPLALNVIHAAMNIFCKLEYRD